MSLYRPSKQFAAWRYRTEMWYNCGMKTIAENANDFVDLQLEILPVAIAERLFDEPPDLRVESLRTRVAGLAVTPSDIALIDISLRKAMIVR